MNPLTTVAAQFQPGCEITAVQEYGAGNVNDTYLVTCNSDRDPRFILQRINTHVFIHPQYIMLNMRTFTEHVFQRLKHNPLNGDHRWQVPRVLPAQDGQDFFIDDEGAFWRAISFIDGSKSYETIQNAAHAREAGYALGQFQSLISDLACDRLYDTLEGFHITPQYLARYDEALAKNGARNHSADVAYGLRFVRERKAWASILEEARLRNDLFLRPIHGDPKINNIMIDETTGRAVSIVDLDTVKPGLVHYDIGDCLRSCCNPLGEETEQIDDVCFDTGLCKAILQGYLSVANDFMTENDYAYLYDAIRLIAFELGLRFFTDYLQGNVYFKVRHEEHNLQRALVQFKLTESIEAQENQIRAIIAEMK
ncbi:MAG: aminoglycoside phosphotransferase family protein [Anaerolineae bacterium]|nr:aminoglycoside phosphotransferase family protein [Anaerolineae bacterium]